MTWEKAGQFVESDVIEWEEPIWSPNRFKKDKSKPWGKQKVIGQIAHVDGDFMKLVILKSAVTENKIGSDLRPHKVGTTITKKRQSLFKGHAQRLHWSEEEVRTALLIKQS
ncbi:MAG: hypothetical protein JNM12_15350 [Alphaproteobacteria bacterium]|nr:hypothetical protein [Alphaproteobacteria bacterium]